MGAAWGSRRRQRQRRRRQEMGEGSRREISTLGATVPSAEAKTVPPPPLEGRGRVNVKAKGESNLDVNALGGKNEALEDGRKRIVRVSLSRCSENLAEPRPEVEPPRGQ
jgi:hypothetical protein